MAQTEGIDCLSPVSADSAAALRAAGRAFVLRYIGSKGNDSLSTAEVARLHAAGLDVGLIFETTGVAALQGAGAGGKLGAQAVGAARTLGAPEGTTIWIAETDFDVRPENVSAVRAFYSAAAQVILLAGYRCGVYGGLVAMQAVAGIAAFCWQTYAWSYGQWAMGVVLRQYQNGARVAGLWCDLDRALFASWGQWSPPPRPSRQRNRGGAMLAVRPDGSAVDYMDVTADGHVIFGDVAADGTLNKGVTPAPYATEVFSPLDATCGLGWTGTASTPGCLVAQLKGVDGVPYVLIRTTDWQQPAAA